VNILIVYHSRLGSVEKMARLIARGVGSVTDCTAVLRSVPEVGSANSRFSADQPNDALVDKSDLQECGGLILGSPTRFGNMSAEMKHFIDATSAEWMSGTLVGKPAAVFTSTSSMHGGQESTLLTMLNPLLHHGMVVCGLPYTEPALHKTKTGGTPYGASHVAGANNELPISPDEKTLCLALGKRLAKMAIALAGVEAKIT
jgi:NAD(P)H dehydrogenase (quinone)